LCVLRDILGWDSRRIFWNLGSYWGFGTHILW